ncbi:glycoside hydrolase family 3 C-terminal domain-containing protein [uncultured Ruthenibacterium sp.]|uniref:beta-glucosidase n=1 Tax=uncultured Ruthenibacterium sp. TaxID=1905347 RepID=UPI00349E8C7B
MQDPFVQVRAEARELVAQMTLEEKAGLCSGKDFWTTRGVERLGLAPIMVTDGPHGLRKQAGAADHMGLNESVPSTCFPPACATACSFDASLAEELGRAMGEECRQEQVAVLLGPAANIKRSPLCGRNFEYFSEDPLVSGRTAAGMIQGVQSQGVGTSLKHYLANNQEKARLTSNSVIDERALREIYLAGFELAVKKAQPWTIMCSYNQINGEYASDNRRLMTDVPRGEWDYQGVILTDWGAMNDRVRAIQAGLDLEMPGPCEENQKLILQAVADGRLREEDLDICARRMAALLLASARRQPMQYDANAHNELARRAARESAVLLKKGASLPLAKTARLAVVGEFARTPRYQGAGSSKIRPHKVTSLCQALDGRGTDYTFCAGYDPEQDAADPALIEEAVNAAQKADVVVACVGLPDRYESEGFDRTSLAMPAGQNALVDALAATGKPVVVVLSCGGALELPWRERVDSILLLYLTGQNGGEAAADLLFADATPCGKLAETWPLSLADCPCGENFGHGGNVEYRESIYVGYRYYDKAGLDVAYPFGHGESYTEFSYSDMRAEPLPDGTVKVQCTVENVGSFAGAEVVQLYVSAQETAAFRPAQELRDYAKKCLAPGERWQVQFHLPRRAFAFYDAAKADWFVEQGTYEIRLGSSSRDIRLTCPVTVPGEPARPDQDKRAAAPDYYGALKGLAHVDRAQFEAVLGHPVPAWPPVRPFTRNSTLSQICCCALGRKVYAEVRQNLSKMTGDTGDLAVLLNAMMEDMPLRQCAMMGSHFPQGLDALLDELNAQPTEE